MAVALVFVIRKLSQRVEPPATKPKSMAVGDTWQSGDRVWPAPVQVTDEQAVPVLTVADAAPAWTGVNRTVTVSAWPLARLYEAPRTMAKTAEGEVTVPERVPAPVLEIVKAASALCPTVTVPKSREVADTWQPGVGVCPVPEQATEEHAVPVESAQEAAPAWVGVNLTSTVSACPAARLYVAPRTMLKAAEGELTVPASVPDPTLEMVKDRSAVWPTSTVPKSSAEALSEHSADGGGAVGGDELLEQLRTVAQAATKTINQGRRNMGGLPGAAEVTRSRRASPAGRSRERTPAGGTPRRGGGR